jgi:hypothetical protein
MEPESIKDLLSQLDALGYFKYNDEEGQEFAWGDALLTGVWYNEGSSRVTWVAAPARSIRGRPEPRSVVS